MRMPLFASSLAIDLPPQQERNARTIPCASSFCQKCSLLQRQCANYRTIKRKNTTMTKPSSMFRLQTKMSGGRANGKVDTDSYSLNWRSETRPWAVSTKPTETIPQVVPSRERGAFGAAPSGQLPDSTSPTTRGSRTYIHNGAKCASCMTCRPRKTLGLQRSYEL